MLFGQVSEIDLAHREVRLTCGHSIGFKRLVLASGAGHGYFGHDEWAQWAPGLKTIKDARHIRSQLLLTFERAERTDDPAERNRLLSVAIIGGGPTGVKLAGAIAELSRYTVARDFRSINPTAAKIAVVAAGPRLLSKSSEDISAYAATRLKRLGVQVRTGEAVDEVQPTSVSIAGQTLPVRLVIWAAGVSASPLAKQLETDRAGRIAADATLAVRGQDDVFALGDVAAFVDDVNRLPIFFHADPQSMSMECHSRAWPKWPSSRESISADHWRRTFAQANRCDRSVTAAEGTLPSWAGTQRSLNTAN